ncbi:hypothetical protein D3C76_1071430 [compost metagenome]
MRNAKIDRALAGDDVITFDQQRIRTGVQLREDASARYRRPDYVADDRALPLVRQTGDGVDEDSDIGRPLELIVRDQDLVGVAVQEHGVLRDVRDVVAVDAHLLADEEGICTAGHVRRLNLRKVENRIAGIVGADRAMCTLRMVDAKVTDITEVTT